jgi:ABC-2 type transport system ATP-binding protein
MIELMDEAAAIEIKNVSVSFGKQTAALRHVSAQLVRGSIIGLIGPSGAGKTTLMRVLVGRQKLTKGSITCLGQAAGSASLRQQLGYMTQEPSIYPDLTVRENLAYFAKMTGLSRRSLQTRIKDVLQVLDLQPQAKQLVAKLSGGQKQRLSLAIAMLAEPRLLVLDEPTVGLDPVLRQQIWQLFRQMVASGTTIIISSHVMDEAERCDDLLLLRDGHLIAHDSAAGLRRQTGSKSVEDSFLSLVGGRLAT